VSDQLAALSHEHHEPDCLARRRRDEVLITLAELREDDAARVAARIATLEAADGDALSAPTPGAVA
jgi:hypothetical protein